MDIQQELIAEFDRETAKARKMLEAIPADADFTWRPHPKSFTLGRLAGHVAETASEWALTTLTKDSLIMPEGQNFPQYIPASKEAMLARFDLKLAEAKAALASFDPAKWDEHWKMGQGTQIWIDETKYRVFREWVLNHLIHHRAQLGVYLRLLEQKIPGTYGPSADGM